jgi:hypothetical protein
MILNFTNQNFIKLIFDYFNCIKSFYYIHYFASLFYINYFPIIFIIKYIFINLFYFNFIFFNSNLNFHE